MDLPNLARDLDKLATADAVVAESYVRYALKKGALYFLACLVAAMGLVLLGLALYWLMAETFGAIAAAALVGVIGCLLAGIIAVVAMVQRPGREFSIAMEMRKSTIATLEQDIGTPSLGSGAYIYPAGEALISSVLLPLLGALIRSLKSPRDKATEKTVELNDLANTPSSPSTPKP